MEENKELEVKENKVEETSLVSTSFTSNSKTKQSVITNIVDNKTLFNLESNCDAKINDCVGETIEVTGFLCKVIEKEMEEPIIDEESGEIIKDTEYKMITILIDRQGKSYVTASKPFFFAWKKYCMVFGEETIENGVVIKIINTPVKNSNNKALGFELV